MKYAVFLFCFAISQIHGWTLDYSGAVQISSPNFSRGRQGYSITCKIEHFSERSKTDSGNLSIL